MSNKINDGGPAYPCVANYEQTMAALQVSKPVDNPQGMSLRDWYKGLAMIAVMNGSGSWPSDEDWPEIARRCGLGADALIAEREKGN